MSDPHRSRAARLCLRLGQLATVLTGVQVVFWGWCGRAAWVPTTSGLCEGRASGEAVLSTATVALAIAGLVPPQGRADVVRGILTLVFGALLLGYSALVGLEHFRGFLI